LRPASQRPRLLPILGQRGRWLAGLNPDWSFAAEASLDALQDEAKLAALWQTGTRNGRMFLLETLRAERPAIARTLIESTWTSEKADDRAAFVEALALGLGPDDEPFLEAALDDRSKEVRATAAKLLARLPASRLARRMAERALGLLRHTGGLLPRLDVQLPEACDKAMERDGIAPRPPHGVGERAWWLAEIVRRTPPAAWSDAWGLGPAAILGTRVAKEWRAPLISAWSAAAIGYRDRAWVVALSELAVREPDDAPLAELLALLPSEQREPLLVRLLETRRHLAGGHPALPALAASDGIWGVTLARAVIAALARRFSRGATYAPREDWPLRSALEAFGRAIPVALIEEALRALPDQLDERDPWAEPLAAFAALLRLRRAFHAALRAEG
jgi:hypothetical protein